MTQTPELHALNDVCARLNGAGIAYMLTGSLAMSYYARPRMTRDIDLVIAVEALEALQLAGVDLWIVSIEDLILSKLEWSQDSRSGQQRADIKLLLDAPFDRAYLEDWATRLDLDRLLAEIENE